MLLLIIMIMIILTSIINILLRLTIIAFELSRLSEVLILSLAGEMLFEAKRQTTNREQWTMNMQLLIPVHILLLLLLIIIIMTILLILTIHTKLNQAINTLT